MKKMLHCISAALLCASASVCASDLPMPNQHTLQLGTEIDYELPSKQPQILSNIFKWTVVADCRIINTEKSHELSFKVLRKRALVNDILLAHGESITAEVEPGESFHMEVEPGATVQLTNHSDESVKTRCIAQAS